MVFIIIELNETSSPIEAVRDTLDKLRWMKAKDVDLKPGTFLEHEGDMRAVYIPYGGGGYMDAFRKLNAIIKKIDRM